MRSIDSDILAELAKQELRPFILLDMEIDSTHYRRTDCDVPIVLGGNTYSPLGFSFGTVSYSSNNIVDSVKVEIDNLDSVMTSLFVGGTPQASPVKIDLVVLDASYDIIGDKLLKILDDCGDTSTITDWVEIEDGLNPVDETTLVKEGSHSMALGIDADLNAADRAYWRNLQSQGDLSAYQHDWLYLWVYIPTLDYVIAGGIAFAFAIGTNASAYKGFSWTKAELSVGWNLLKCDLDNPDSSIGAITWTDISFLHIQINTVVGNTNDFTLYVDSIMFVRPASDSATLFEGEIDAWDLDEEKLSITVTSLFSQWSQRTLSKHSASCRWKKFKGTECGYSGGETWCDRTYARCVGLANIANFGGFRWLPSIIDKEIWWGRVQGTS